MWTKHEKYDEMVKDAWQANQGSWHGLPGLWERLRGVSAQMKRWSFEVFGSVRQQIKKLRASLDEARMNSLDSGSMEEVRRLEKQLHEVYEREEIMYKQRSRQEWLKEGDRNTRYFQNRV
jgi:hypothetical protein